MAWKSSALSVLLVGRFSAIAVMVLIAFCMRVAVVLFTPSPWAKVLVTPTAPVRSALAAPINKSRWAVGLSCAVLPVPVMLLSMLLSTWLVFRL